MKIKNSLLGITLVGITASMSVAHAAPPVTDAAGNFVYLGIKGGIMSNDVPFADDAINLGAYGGYHLLGEGANTPMNLGGGTLSVEGEFTATVVEGDFGAFGEWSVMTLAGYAAYRFPLANTFYLKAKAGARWMDIDTNLPVGWDGSDTGGSFGVGAGMHLGSGSLEAELTIIENDITFLTLGYLF